MDYNLAKKLIILLKEYDNQQDNYFLQQELIDTIFKLKERDYIDLCYHKDECCKKLDYNDITDLIIDINHLSISIMEDCCSDKCL